jgi:hypothetical protein
VKWPTSGGDTVEVYETAITCLRDDCAVYHREYRYRVTAANGEIVEQGSEGYTRKAAAVAAAERHHPRVES